MTFKEFKKRLVDADITIPKLAKLIGVSEKNIQSYKKKDAVPNQIAAIAELIKVMEEKDIDYKEILSNLQLTKNSKNSGFAKKDEGRKEK